jgi:spore maturation protein CgeB
VARILIVHPGPDFSVADVYRGWQKALSKLGHTVMTYNTNDRLTFYGRALMEDPEQEACEHGRKAVKSAMPDGASAIQMAVKGLFETCFVFWPEVIFFVSGFYMTPAMLQVLRTRRMKIVMLHTESPYQDDEQMVRGQLADLNLLNDPVNLAAWKDLDVPAAYMPHAYDPDVHYPAAQQNYEADFLFVGTMFRSRAEFFSQMDFSGLRVAFGGAGWNLAVSDYPELVKDLVQYVAHPLDYCVDNEEAASNYRIAKCGINFYRREGEDAHAGEGWAMGPREVEQAACGLFFLRDPRPESDEVFGRILPAFGSADEASQELRYWVKNDALREYRANQAREAIADRTFDNNAKAALKLMEEAAIL